MSIFPGPLYNLWWNISLNVRIGNLEILSVEYMANLNTDGDHVTMRGLASWSARNAQLIIWQMLFVDGQ